MYIDLFSYSIGGKKMYAGRYLLDVYHSDKYFDLLSLVTVMNTYLFSLTTFKTLLSCYLPILLFSPVLILSYSYSSFCFLSLYFICHIFVFKFPQFSNCFFVWITFYLVLDLSFSLSFSYLPFFVCSGLWGRSMESQSRSSGQVSL